MREMTPPEASQFLRSNHAGVLALADGGDAYGVPLYYAYDGRDLYFQTRPGLKQRYAVATGEACFTVVRVTAPDSWASVQVFGPLERIEPSLRAQDALLSVPLPPDWGEGPRGEPQRHARDVVLYKLHARRVSGRYSNAAPESPEERELAFGGM